MKKTSFIVLVMLLLLVGILAGCGSESTVREDNNVQPYQFTTSQLQQYVIVYEGANPDYAALANELAEHLMDQYGAFLTTAKDTDSQPAPFEILLGDTNRTEGVSKVMEYAVTVAQGQLIIHPRRS